METRNNRDGQLLALSPEELEQSAEEGAAEAQRQRKEYLERLYRPVSSGHMTYEEYLRQVRPRCGCR